MKLKISICYKLIILLIIIPIFIIFIFKTISDYEIASANKSLKDERILYSNTINFKGKNILKSKLLDDYLYGISDIYLSAKVQEREKFNKYFYLSDSSEDVSIKKALKDKILEFISKKKNQTITHLDIFYLKKTLPFGNNIITLSNAIFFCEVVGCHKIVLNNKKLKYSWFISKPIYIKNSNITIFLI